MIKGRTTIQLRNAKTGEVEREIKHDNIVTNAVQNVFSLPYAVRSLYSTNSSEATGYGKDWEEMIRGQNMPYYAKAYGGISLFRDAIALDADNVLIDGTNKLVGYAGDVGTEIEADMLCGERNATESKEIENGYHFVWDFDTEKANGTFRSVSLGLTDSTKYSTTNNSGHYGFNPLFKCDSTANSSSDVPAKSWWTWWFNVGFTLQIEGKAMLTRVVYLEELDNKDVVIYTVTLAEDSDRYTNVQITKTTWEPFNKISIFSKQKFIHKKTEVLRAERLPSSAQESRYYNAYTQNIQIDSDNNIHILYFADQAQSGSSYYYSKKFVHTIYALDGTMISSKVIPFPATKRYSAVSKTVPCGFYNGLYYDIAPNANKVYCLRRFNESGVIVDEVELPENWIANNYYNPRMSRFSVTSAGIAQVGYSAERDSITQTNLYLLPSGEGEKPQLLQRSAAGANFSNMNCNYPSIKPPFQLISDYSTTSGGVGIVASPHYLGTINNLDTAVTKTNAQTMKIIYDLVEE